METTIGTLFGIGVGPGDPELIPLKSVKILGRVDVVFCRCIHQKSPQSRGQHRQTVYSGNDFRKYALISNDQR